MTRQTEIESQFLSEATACALQTAGSSFIFPMKKTRLTEKKRFVGTFPVAEDDRLGRDGVLPKPPSGATGKRLFTLANLVTRRIPLVFANPAS